MSINNYIEHTSLKPTLVADDIDKLVEEAINYNFLGICVPGFWVKKAARDLQNHDIKLISVAGFPLGYNMTEVKLEEIRMAIGNGANEMDIVMNVSAFKSDMNWPKIEMSKAATLCHEHGVALKVILETAYLTDDEIVDASVMCEEAGADFVKTSTGFGPHGAKVEHVQLMRNAVSDQVGIKAAGGIRTLEEAQAMIRAGADRIGTSNGVQIVKDLEQAN
jgi:deoxyribose-phosphate aldolase